MIRKSSLSLEFANLGKYTELLRVLEESVRVLNEFTEKLWSLERFNCKFITLSTETWLSARMQQALSKQALEVTKAARSKKQGKMPVFSKLSVNLDSRFIKFLPLKNSFDFWVKIGSLAKSLSVTVPAKKHRHFNGFAESGWKLKGSVKLYQRGDGKLMLDVYFEKEAHELKTEGKDIGIDIGYKKLIVTSEGQMIGDQFDKIAAKIQRKVQDSVGFKKALKERDCYVNKAAKELKLEGVKSVVLEELKGLKDGRRFRKEFHGKFQRWTYPVLVNRLKSICERQGVLVNQVYPAYTSQTCSRCGCKDKKSRNGEHFTCTACGFAIDADLNASRNILTKFRLPENIDPVKEVLRL